MEHKHSLKLGFWSQRILPVILQTEAAECALACLAMIAGYWGHTMDMASMRRRYSVSLKGATLKSLMSMAQGLALQPRALKLDLPQLHSLRLPCVLHWNMNHFVVLKKVGRTRVVIHDPALGERGLSMQELSKHFTGVALEMSPSATFTPVVETRPFTILSLMGRVFGLKRGLIQLLGLGIALQVCAIAAPFYLQWIVDDALVSSDRNLVTVLGLGFMLLVLVQGAIGGVRSWLTTMLATDLNFQWFGNVFAHLMKLPLPYFEKRHDGDMMSRFTSIQAIQHSLTTQFVEGVIDGLLVLGTLAIMLVYSPQLSAIAGIAVLLYAALKWVLFRPLRDATQEQIIHAAKQQTHLLESMRGVQSVRLFSRAEERRMGWMNMLAEQFNSDLRIARITISQQTANTLIFNVERIVIVWLAALAVMDTRFSVGMLFAFLSYKDQFSQRLASLIDKVFEFRMLKLHGERVADMVLSEAEEEPLVDEALIEQLQPSVEVCNLSFRYADGEPYIFKDFNLSIPAGQCVAITGVSGCGKTTLLKLLLGLLEPTEGEIRIGGHKLATIGLANYRRIVGTVMQDEQLFCGSIADNISFFDPVPDAARIEACAQLAAIHHDICAMPMAYNSLVSAGGAGLSGGQAQRILLARALYKQPRLLYLDEATSHLDIGSEQYVNAGIEKMDLTRILIAHRPDTISMAQRIIVLEHGRIARDFENVKVNAHASGQESRCA